MKIELESLTVENTRKHLLAGDFSAVELASAYLNQIRATNSEINAYLEVFDDVIKQAKAADQDINHGSLSGIPIAVKDNIMLEGKRVSAASKILEGYTATYDSTVAKRLKAAGAIFLGRTNMDEFAMGSSTENSAYGVTRNPHDLSTVAGGSSGGSAAAVSANLALVALGTDTGGSVRQPAAFCGVVGLYPTYGRVSRFGVIALGSSLDQVGPIGKTVSDVETIFDVISGPDASDATSLQAKVESNSTKVVGVPRKLLEKGLSPDTLSNFNETLAGLEKLGYKIVDIELPLVSYSLPIYYIIMPAEASSNLARYDGMRFGLRQDGDSLFSTYTQSRGVGFGEEVKRRILTGTYVLSHGYYDAYYGRAKLARQAIKQEFGKVFQSVDIIALPTSPDTAFKIGERRGDPVSMYLSDIFTAPANIAGLPALSVPSGKDQKGLPIGFQLMGRAFNEKLLFKVGREVESLAKA